MAAFSALRAGLATRLTTITGLRVHDTVPGEVTVPAAVVEPGNPAITFDSTMARGSDEFRFNVRLLVSTTNDRTAQNALDAYLAGSGTGSVKAAIEADPTLGGIADYAVLVQVSDYGLIEYAGVQYLGAELLVEVGA